MVARQLPQLAGLRLAIRDGHDPLPGRINRQLLDRRLADDRASETLNFRRHQTWHDFGTIPGTDKPTLYQGGAQKINTCFRLRPEPKAIRRYDLPRLHGFNFVLDEALEGGVNRSLNLDGHGKSWSAGNITLAWGRDYADVAPIKGVTLGGGAHTITVEVVIEEA